jgi:hypothetical protein
MKYTGWYQNDFNAEHLLAPGVVDIDLPREGLSEYEGGLSFVHVIF